MHGGVKVYRGAAGAARTYVEADRSRADDYYLSEGTGVARRYAATGVGAVAELPEQLLARTGIVADPAVRRELAEDLTARSLALSVPLLARTGVPDHVRAWTSAHVVEVEADLAGRLAVRAAEPAVGTDPLARTRLAVTAGGTGLDAGQIAAVAALAGDRALVVVEGVAGAGKTTTLAATRDLLTGQGQRLVVVTPTLKAAKAAAVEIGARAGSAAWLVHQHGWRWTAGGTWTRLAAGDSDPVTGRDYTGPAPAARLTAGDLLVVDEAGLLDQDTARADHRRRKRRPGRLPRGSAPAGRGRPRRRPGPGRPLG